ncbi:hypothetical protein GCM10009765_64880 [Fodinicola feengrottensis]|uniref:N-acetyltransferase domain-containing protein n=1 Tax=Fodinicola feengrottensis TaxID=435914 RepID=A0ABP4UJE6_9ACTN
MRQCRAADVELLEKYHPGPGRTKVNEMRFGRQEQGVGTFLVAWLDDVPTGSGEIRWEGCEAPEVLRRFPDCPEINGLTIWPAEHRSQGIGSQFIRAAEALAVERGFDRIGLGVDDDNPAAAALYLRIGYQDVDCRYLDRYHYLDDDGVRHEVADPARFLVKHLG